MLTGVRLWIMFTDCGHPTFVGSQKRAFAREHDTLANRWENTSSLGLSDRGALGERRHFMEIVTIELTDGASL